MATTYGKYGLPAAHLHLGTPGDGGQLDGSLALFSTVLSDAQIDAAICRDAELATHAGLSTVHHEFVEHISASHSVGVSMSWQDWDISAEIPVDCIAVLIGHEVEYSGDEDKGVRENGSVQDRMYPYGETSNGVNWLVKPDGSRIIEVRGRTADKWYVLGWFV